MNFSSCDFIKKIFFHRTSDDSSDFSILILSNKTNSPNKFIHISKHSLIVFCIFVLLSLGGLSRCIYILLSRVQHDTIIHIEQNRNQKLTIGLKLLDSYLTDFLKDGQDHCEIPQIEILPYSQISKAGVFLFDQSVFSDFKYFVRYFEKISPSYISKSDITNLNQKDLCFISPTYGNISSYFGIRTDPVYEGTEKHSGIDIAGQRSSKVVCTANGKVVFAGWKERYGNVVIISHGNTGIQTIYAHLDLITAKIGDSLTAGTKIGLLGSTGKATGPHLHYEVRINSVAVNPIPYLYPNNLVIE